MEYKFGRAASACSVCEHRFAEGERFISALSAAEAAEAESADEESLFARLDVCNGCWPELPREPLISWWLNAKEVRPPKPPTADPEFLWLLLGHTLSQHDPELDDAARQPLAVHLGYLAALGLLRLKHVQLGRHRRIGERSYQSFVPRESRQREIVVLDPEPSDEALALVEEKLRAFAEAVRGGKEFAELLAAEAEKLPAALSLEKNGKKRRTKKKARAERNVTRI